MTIEAASKSNKRFEFPTPRDFFYCIAILAGLCVVLITVNVAYDDLLSAYVQFGSSLVSIILALVAIFYTFSQGAAQQGSAFRLEVATAEIAMETKKLSEDIERQAKDGEALSLGLKGLVSEIESRLASAVAEANTRQTDQIANMLGAIGGSLTDTQDDSSEDSGDPVLALTKAIGAYPELRPFFQLLHAAGKENRRLSLGDVVEATIPFEGEVESGFTSGMAIAWLIALSRLGGLKMSKKDGTFLVTDFREPVQDMLAETDQGEIAKAEAWLKANPPGTIQQEKGRS